MNIHEYQAKELLANYGVPVPAGYAAMTVEEAVEAANKLPGPLWVVKAQIHAGGRGKGRFKELGESAEKITTITVDPATGLMPHHGRAVAAALGLTGDLAKQAGKVLGSLYQAFLGTDASQVEINPLAVDDKGRLLVLDAKVGFDNNAEFRHPDLEQLRDLTEEDPMEIEASKYDLSYIKLDGSIGCMVNGAGLAMATMDIIKLEGGEPANFLDVGGGASKEKVTAAFKIILSDPSVKGILVNIFGGIMRCDIIA